MSTFYQRKSDKLCYVRYKDSSGKWRAKSLKTRDKIEGLDRWRAFDTDRDKLNHPISIKYGIELYLNETRKTCAPSTTYNYGLRLRQLRTWIEGVQHIFMVHEITPNLIREYRDSRNGSASNVHQCLRVTHSWLQWLLQEELIGANPMRRVRYPKVHVKLITEVRYLDKSELKVLLDKGKYSNSYPGFIFAVFTGLRRGEMLALRFKDIHLKEGYVHVLQNKTGREKHIPLHAKLTAYLNTYMIGKKTNALYYPYSLSTLRRHWEKFRADQGWHYRFHDLRHTFASHLVMAGVSIYKVSQWLGHTSIRTTQIYAHLAPSDPDIDKWI